MSENSDLHSSIPGAQRYQGPERPCDECSTYQTLDSEHLDLTVDKAVWVVGGDYLCEACGLF